MLKTVAQSATTGALNYQGTWDASANSPTLTSSVGTKGYYYVVSVAGTTNLNGITDWQIGDWAVFNGTAWQKVDNTDAVTSVNGQTGAVVLGVANIAGAVPNTTTVTAAGLLSGGGNLASNVTITLNNVPVANVPGAVPNTVNVLASGLLSGGGALTGNVTITLNNVPAANVTGLGTMATQNANNVLITGGNAVLTSANATNSTITNLSTGNATITGGTENNVSYTNVSILSGNVTANLTVLNATNANATYQTSSLPLVPAGYIQMQLANATVVKVPYYKA